jgi:N-acetylglutamate synthase-like GNAT family acetyltransferase
MINIRNYRPLDYLQLIELYKQGDLYGGQFDEDRDSAERLEKKITQDSEAIWVCEFDGKLIGTVSIIEDGRTAWLFRFAISKNQREADIAHLLYEKVVEVLKKKGHKQVLVYAPTKNVIFKNRYNDLGFHEGGDYTCYWREI